MKTVIVCFLLAIISEASAKTTPPETKEIIEPTSKFVHKTEDDFNLRGHIYDFSPKPTLTLLFVVPLSQIPQNFLSFLAEIKSYPWRVVITDLRGHGMSEKRASGGSASWKFFSKSDFEKMANDVAFVAQKVKVGPLFLVGFDFSALVITKSVKKTQPHGIILISPIESSQGLVATPGDLKGAGHLFAAAGPEDALGFSTLQKWSGDLPSFKSDPIIIMEKGLGQGMGLLLYTPLIREKIWRWIAQVSRK